MRVVRLFVAASFACLSAGTGVEAAEASKEVRSASVQCGVKARRKGEPGNERLKSRGVSDDSMDVPSAVAACSAAVSENPEDVPSRFRLARALFLSGQYQAAFPHAQTAAQSGYAPAEALLADLYLRGEQVTRDLDRFAELSISAAEKNDGDGLNNVGFMYENGIHFDADIDKAFAYYQEADKNFSVLGTYNVARLYLVKAKATGNENNERFYAYSYFRSAAHKGFDRAWLASGYLHLEDSKDTRFSEDDRGLDYQSARIDFRKASESKNPIVASEGEKARALVKKGFGGGISSGEVLVFGLIALGALAAMSGSDGGSASSSGSADKSPCPYSSDNPYLSYGWRVYVASYGC